MNKGKLLTRAMDLTVDTGTTGILDTVGDIAYADCREQDHISVLVNQIVDAGTVIILVEKTGDGTNWALVATLTEASFPAGANTAKEVTLSDASGMPTRATAVRARVTAVAGGGTYGATIVGAATGHHT